MTWGEIEVEPEVEKWYLGLSEQHRGRTSFYIDLLAAKGVLLGAPYAKQLDGKLRELRFYLDGESMRITYWIASGRRIILLTVFRKQRMRETDEVERAIRSMRDCMVQEHSADEE
ncbi:type II toxin-antitoxin system RelE/ParE family toxin [Streptomyces sp. NPDC088261]|uniref:type II toxin-antitoxin system RelE/ParE family toxin n=1 Tax=Streptomyces sp. NPDC088261 TaxID=3365851 RepID=UPI0038261AF3